MKKQLFEYGEEELSYLKERDARLAEAIDKIGYIEREVNPDLFSALVRTIVGQQISSKAQATICQRMVDSLGGITAEKIAAVPPEEIQKFGISFRKAAYIQNVANSVLEGSLELEKLCEMSDEELCQNLASLEGIGVWTAEMLMIFSLQRRNILNYGDLAILRGMRMLYHHRAISRELFAKYKRRYTPYASVASFYLWAIAGGAIEDMKDYAPKKSSAQPQKPSGAI